MAEEKAKTVVQEVSMADGRTVGFAGKRKMIKEAIETSDGVKGVRFDFRNGNSLFWPIDHGGLQEAYALHGIKQKGGDNAAGTEDVDDVQLDVEAAFEQCGKGIWKEQREGSGMGGTSVLLRALVEVSGKSVEEIKAFLKDKSQAEKMALRESSKVKPIVQRIEAEKVAKSAKVDTDGLLAGLGV